MGERLSQGIILKADKTVVPGTTYVEIAAMTEVSLPSETASSLDRSTLKLDRRSYRPGLYDPGEVTFGVFYDPADANHQWLRTQVKARVARAWRVVIPKEAPADSDYGVDFVGFLTAFTPTGSVDELLTADITIKLDSDVTYGVVT